MKLTFYPFSNLVQKKSKVLLDCLKSSQVEILNWKHLKEADGVILHNIHGSVKQAINEAYFSKKKILSLQEGMYGIGWKETLSAMRAECQNANNKEIVQFVWSDFEVKNYIKTGKKKSLLEAVGNPEHDLLYSSPIITRKSYGIPSDAFVVAYIAQYKHPAAGASELQLSHMERSIERLGALNDKIWTITMLHPKKSFKNEVKIKERHIIRPFSYPIFDVLRFSDLVISLSSTEMITAAILGKPIIEYDISNTPSRFPFVEHEVAVRANSDEELNEYVELFMRGKKLNGLNYKEAYKADGNSVKRVANSILEFFNEK